MESMDHCSDDPDLTYPNLKSRRTHGSDHAWIGQHKCGAPANWVKLVALRATSLTTTRSSRDQMESDLDATMASGTEMITVPMTLTQLI
jgi:hypothetical protein